MLTLPLLVCIIGWLVWFFFSRPVPNPHWSHSLLARTGEILFAAGALATLFGLITKVVY